MIGLSSIGLRSNALSSIWPKWHWPKWQKAAGVCFFGHMSLGQAIFVLSPMLLRPMSLGPEKKYQNTNVTWANFSKAKFGRSRE